MRQAGQDPLEDHPRLLARRQRSGQRGMLDRLLDDCFAGGLLGDLVRLGVGRISLGPLIDGKAHRLGDEQSEDADRQAGQARDIEVWLQERPTGQPEVEQAADQPEQRAQEQPDESPPGCASPVTDQDHHPRRQGEHEQEVEVADAPEPAELEEQRDAEQERPEQPDFRPDPQVGDQRTIHDSLSIAGILGRAGNPPRSFASLKSRRIAILGDRMPGSQGAGHRSRKGQGKRLISQPRTGSRSPESWLRALSAARCSASFLFRPQAGG